MSSISEFARAEQEAPIADPPTRRFGVKVEGAIQGSTIAVLVEAHTCDVGPSGSITFYRQKRGSFWTVLVLPAGQWAGVQAEMPSDADIELAESLNRAAAKREYEANLRATAEAHANVGAAYNADTDGNLQ